MKVSELVREHLTNDIIDSLLYEGISPADQSADCIVVLGSIKATEYRIPVAVDAYHAGLSRKIMLCGGAIRDFHNGRRSEAEQMYNKCIELGVAPSDIIMENSSQNTIENILFALVELQRNFWLNKVKNILLVTTTYHMRRSLAIAEYYFPAHIKIIPCPADDINTVRGNWMNSPKGIERATNEAQNIIDCVNNGVIPDFSIPTAKQNTIFLDIDGVMDVYNPNLFTQELLPEAIANLKDLVNAIGGKIVIISDWRYGSPLFREKAAKQGFEKKIANWDNLAKTFLLEGLQIQDVTPWDEALPNRTSEIEQYLAQHPEITNYVILDDCFSDCFDSNLAIKRHLIFVDALKGLSKVNILAAKALFTKK